MKQQFCDVFQNKSRSEQGWENGEGISKSSPYNLLQDRGKEVRPVFLPLPFHDFLQTT